MKKRIIILTAVVILLILTVSCAQQSIKSAESSIYEMGDVKKIKVTNIKGSIRQGCSNDSPVMQEAEKNSKFDVISKVADWYAVNLEENKIGFINQNDCRPIVPDDKNKADQTDADTGKRDLSAVPDRNKNPDKNLAQGNTQQTKPTIPEEQTDTAGLTNQENQMFELVNSARAQNNLPPLKIDMELVNVARIKSQDMIDNNYFSHHSPTYGSPFDMMNDFGIEYVHAGENIAGNRDVENAHNSLMNSPGHRKNILNNDFTHIGIGIKRGGGYGNMFTQMFISKPK